ncbi:MAG: MGMT family protein [Candidatus Auribacterota bacterium]|nr:MGMT family protein [Candidatus Auribacterota bacterium]
MNSFLGPIRLKWDGASLSGVILPLSPPPEISPSKNWKQGRDWYDILKLNGVELSLEGHRPFELAVWHQTGMIPWGETRSYGWIARKIDRPGVARAVGRALGANPWPLLVPCHRVIRSDGTIGGFSSGLKWKLFLLNLEKKLIWAG